MTKDQYLRAKGNIEAEIEDLKSLLSTLHKDYVEEHSDFNLNERVRIVTRAHKDTRTVFATGRDITTDVPGKTRYAYVKSIEIILGNLVYRLVKENRHGNQSVVRDYLGNYDTIQKVQ